MIYTPGCIELDISWLCNSDKEDHLTLTDDGDDHLGSANSLHLTLSGHFATSLMTMNRIHRNHCQKIHSILSYILDARLMLESFLHAISWGNHDCVCDPQICAAHTALMNSPKLSIILKYWWMPPQSATSWKSCTHGAHSIIEQFSVECLQSILTHGLDTLYDCFWTPDDVQEDFFTGTHFAQLVEQCKIIALILWRLLLASAHTKKQADWITKKNPSKFCGLSAKAFDTLHALAVTMSHRWAADHVARISWSAMQEVTVFSQQLDNKDSFSNGVAATVYIKQQATAPAPEVSKLLSPHIETYTTYYVLQFLLDAPEFQLSTYPYQHSPLLQPPHPVHAIPHGPEHIPLQYLLGSINVAEVSYADNEHVLTVDHLWGLFKFCSQDINSFDRLDWMILVFGWLHLQMAFANSLHKQYLGTAAGQGLMHAFTVLKQKGLGSALTKGPFHHDLVEAIDHVNLEDLRSCQSEELVSYAHQLIDEHASSGVLDQMDALPLDKQDEVKHQTILWNHDVLHYIVLDQAIKQGDNSKCAIEVLELLQGLHWEWSLAVWYVTYRSEGSNIQWEYFKKLHPVICLICELGKHIEQEFNTQTCRKHHSTPSKDADVKLLKSAYQSSNTHSYLPDCKLKGSKRDKVQDIVTKGLEKLHTGQTLWHWNFG
ncbi:hypothetical protein V8B97DRAFT_2022281 [Scleroderma yunnanense]